MTNLVTVSRSPDDVQLANVGERLQGLLGDQVRSRAQAEQVLPRVLYGSNIES